MAQNQLFLLVLLLGIVARGLSFSCPGPCDSVDCTAPPRGCSYGLVRDACGCCYECGKGPGEECVSGLYESSIGTCGDGLKCVKPSNQDYPGVYGVCTNACEDTWPTNLCIDGERTLPDGTKTFVGGCSCSDIKSSGQCDNPGYGRGSCIKTCGNCGISSQSWTSATNACIIGHNNLVLDGLSSLAACKLRCQSQIGFVCRSAEYHARSGRCVLSEATIEEASEGAYRPDYRQPCTSNGWTFTEIIPDHLPGLPRS